MSESETQAASKQQFSIQRIYTKDISFESPSTPAIFKQDWAPDMNMDIHSTSKDIGDGMYEVVVDITVTVKSADKTAFLVEVKQAGIFAIANFPEEQQHHLLGSYCPSIIYPYAREVITDVVQRASFPQLILAPINFDALYAEQLKKQKAPAEANTQDKEASTQV